MCLLPAAQVHQLQLQGSDTQPDQALQVLQEQGIVEQLARTITAPPILTAQASAHVGSMDGTCTCCLCTGSRLLASAYVHWHSAADRAA